MNNLFGISYSDLVSDYVAGNTSDVITEERAQNIAQWLPKLRSLRKEISDKISKNVGKRIYPDLVLSKKSQQSLLDGDQSENHPLEFNLLYNERPECMPSEDKPDTCGSFTYRANFSSIGARINLSGSLTPFKRSGSVDDYLIDEYSLNGLSDASEFHQELIYFDEYSPINGHEDISITLLNETGSRFQDDFGNLSQNGANYDDVYRVCTFMDQISSRSLPLPEGIEGLRLGFRNNATARGVDLAECGSLKESDKRQFILFFTLTSLSGTNEEIDVQYNVPSISEAVFLENKLINLWENRDNLKLTEYLNEVRNLPYLFSNLNLLREKTISWNGPNYVDFIFKKEINSPNQENYLFRMHYNNKSLDEFVRLSHEDDKVMGQEARNRFHELLKNSNSFNSDLVAGTEAP